MIPRARGQNQGIGESQQLQRVAVEFLALDPQNPRLPEELLGHSQEELLTWLNEEEVLDELARSMLENGFFEHEPLVVLSQDDAGNYTVVEGNRRLAALTILLQLPSAQAANLTFDFLSLPNQVQLDRLRTVPCFVVSDRQEVRKFLGFRHIGGLKTWSPESKARYLEAEIEHAVEEGSNDAFRDVARRVGSTVPAVRGQYLALKVLREARELGIDSRYIIRERFGVWNRLLNSPEVRRYIGLDAVSTVDEVRTVSKTLNPLGLRQVITDLTPADSGTKPVLWDSRDVTIYGKVISNERALASLMKFGDLAVARQIVERGAVTERLRTITRSIEAITQDIDSYEINSDTEAVAAALVSAARTLSATIKGRLEDDDND
ncbi:hypothetical protein [Arthrobacter sp. D1-17]